MAPVASAGNGHCTGRNEAAEADEESFFEVLHRNECQTTAPTSGQDLSRLHHAWDTLRHLQALDPRLTAATLVVH